MLKIKQLQNEIIGPIDLEIKPVQCIGLSGESGAGKSRLLRAIADLDEHTGQVELNQESYLEILPFNWRKQVGLLPADSQWWFDSVGEHFERIDKELLKLLGFSEDVTSWSISRISSGEKQRLALMRLLSNKPKVLLLDEPTANLDRNNTNIFENIIKTYLSKNDACAIWVSHDADQLDRVSTHQFKIADGKLIKQ